ncbi:MAG: orotidine-5'-phosphate decarboxylase [Thermodesulfobacteriota bacterium]
MKRRDISPRERLVFPLDVPDWAAARSLVETLKDHVGWFKIGLELFISHGPDAVGQVRRITGGRTRIFLDLKLHDIPATVSRAMAQAAKLGADLVTVHVGDGGQMIRAAKEAAGPAQVLAVTVLTSVDLTENLGFAVEYTRPEALVLLRARLARAAGCDGFVCSGREVEVIRNVFGPEPLVVTPGIRPAWSLVEGDDQRRVVTPRLAIQAGADLLVVGRPIRDAKDPARAAAEVVAEIEQALGE